jgi:hypothetical protein
LLALIPLAVLGVFLFGVAVRNLALWQRAQSWVERPATVLEVFLRHGGRRGAASVEARYEYEMDGTFYESDRVGIFGGGLSNFAEEMAAELEEAKRVGAPVSCYVNPVDVRDALLDRELHPGDLAINLLLALASSVIAALVFRTCRFNWRNQQLLREIAPSNDA